MKRTALRSAFALCYYLLFCYAALSAQVVTLPHPVRSLSVNADDSILAVSDAATLATYHTSGYTLISAIRAEAINRSLFYQEQNAELLIAMTYAGKFLLYRQSAGKKNAYSQIEKYMLTDYGDGKTISCSAFSKNTNYSAAAFTDFSIQIHFKLRFTKEMITRTVEGHQSLIYGLTFSNDEKYLASVSQDGAAYIWSCANYKQVARIGNVYTKSEIPVYFTADSAALISMEESASLRISNLQGKKRTSINTGKAILALLPLSDPDKVAVVHDTNEIIIYSIGQRKAVGVMRLPQTETSHITAFDFCHSERAAFVGCESGAVYKLNLEELQNAHNESPESGTHNAAGDEPQQTVLPHTKAKPEGSAASRTQDEHLSPAAPQHQDGQAVQEKPAQDTPLAEEPVEADKPFKPALKNEKASFLTISTLMGFLQPEKTNFRFLFGADICFRNTSFTAPVYIGMGVRAYMALPKKPFPVQYEDFNGNPIAPPFLWMGEVYLPVGIEVVLNRSGSIVLFEEASFTTRISALARPKVTSSKPFFSCGGRLTTGISVKFFTFALALNYDSVWKLFPEITLGGRIDLKSASKAQKEPV